MKSKFKSPVLILSIVFGIFVIGWIALFVTIGLTHPTFSKNIVNEIKLFFETVISAAKFEGGFKGASSIPSYTFYGFCLVALVLIIVNIIVAAKKHKPVFLLYIIAILVGSIPALNTALDMATFGEAGIYISGMKNTFGIPSMVLCYATVVSAGLAYLLMIVLFIVTSCAYGTDEVEAVTTDVVTDSAAADEVKEEVKDDVDLNSEVELMPVFETEPEEVKEEPEPVVAEEVKEEPVEETTKEEVKEPVLTKEDILAFLKDSVRDIVRDEIARNNLEHEKCHHHEEKASTDNHSITGATFGGPLIVQNFYGVNPTQNVQTPAPEVKKEEPVEPKVIERIIEKHIPVEVVRVVEEEPAKEEEKVEEEKVETPVVKEEAPAPVVEETAPAVNEEPVVETPVEKKPIIRIPFNERMINAEQEMKDNYNTLKNEILSYGVKSRVSNSGDTFRLHRKTYVKITIAGKSLKCYFALDPEEYRESTVPVQSAAEKNVYADIPLVFKVKSVLSVKRAKQLIQDVMEKNELEQGEVGNTDWAKELENVSSKEEDED